MASATVPLLVPQFAEAESLRVRVGIYQNAPKIYVDKQGKAAGFFPEILNDIAAREGWTLEYVPCNWAACLADVGNGTLDLMPDVALTPEREERFAFNREVVLGNWSRVYARDAHTFHSILDLDGRRVAVIQGSVQDRRLTEDARSYGIEPDIVEVDTPAAVFEKVARGEADAGIVNRLFGERQKANFHLQATDIVLYPSKLMFAAPKSGNAAILDRIDDRLEALKKDRNSVYYRAVAKLLGPGERIVAPAVPLDRREQAWLAGHPVITLGGGMLQPWDFRDKNGRAVGIGPDYLSELGDLLGVTFRLTTGPPAEAEAQARSRKIDGIRLLTAEKAAALDLTMTAPVIEMTEGVWTTRSASPVHSLQDLEEHDVAVLRNSGEQAFLAARHAKIRLVPVASYGEAIAALRDGRATALIGPVATVSRALSKDTLGDLRVAFVIREMTHDLGIGVRKDWPLLVGILNKALDTMSPQRKLAIRRKWMPPEFDLEGRLGLTGVEKAWLANHPILRVGYDPGWYPIEFATRNGEFSGMSADYMARIAALLGIKIEPEKPTEWQKTLEDLRNGKLDFVSSVASTFRRRRFMIFTRPYLSLPIVIVSRESDPYVGELAQLTGQRVAVVAGYAIQEILATRHPNLTLVVVPNVEAGLTAVLEGHADAYVDTMATVSYMIGRSGLVGLKVSGQTPYRYDLAIGVRKDEPILAGILQKALDAVGEEERNAIHRKWLNVTVHQRVDYRKVIGFALVLVAALSAILLWNVSLKRTVARRTAQLRHSEAELKSAYDDLEVKVEQRTAELRRSEERVERERNLLRTVLESMAQGIVAFDREMKLVAWNERFLKIRDYPETLAVEGTDFSEFMKYDVERNEFGDMDPEQEIQFQVTRARKGLPHKFERRRPNDTFIEVQGGPIPDGGFVSTYTDVTDRKRMEEDLKAALENVAAANVRLQDLDRLKSMFVATMSHELRTPLNSIIGFTGIMLQGMVGELNDKQRDHLSRAYRSARHLLRLITDIIDISKIEAGRIDVVPEPFALEELIGEATDSIQPQLEQKNLSLVVEQPPGILMNTDRKRLLQALLNFLSNAVKYTETGEVGIIITEEDDKAHIAVRDSGIGIAVDDLPRLFLPFERLESHLTVQAGGTGLGLYLTRKLIEDILHGTIWAESTLGEGSTFHMLVPKDLGQVLVAERAAAEKEVSG